MIFLNTCIIAWCDGHELCLYAVADLQLLDKLMDSLFRHMLVGTGQGLQCFIGMRIGLTTENGLDGFSHNSPIVLKVVIDSLLVEKQLAQPLLQ